MWYMCNVGDAMVANCFWLKAIAEHVWLESTLCEPSSSSSSRGYGLKPYNSTKTARLLLAQCSNPSPKTLCGVQLMRQPLPTKGLEFCIAHKREREKRNRGKTIRSRILHILQTW